MRRWKTVDKERKFNDKGREYMGEGGERKYDDEEREIKMTRRENIWVKEERKNIMMRREKIRYEKIEYKTTTREKLR